MSKRRFGFHALLVAGAACGGSDPAGYGGESGGGNPPPPPPPSGSISTVAMREYSFTPSNLTVKVGTAVRWTNNGAVAHTTTSDAGVWASGSINAPGTDPYGDPTPGGSYERTFAAAGTYPYHCAFHASLGMRGTVTVTP